MTSKVIPDRAPAACPCPSPLQKPRSNVKETKVLCRQQSRNNHYTRSTHTNEIQQQCDVQERRREVTRSLAWCQVKNFRPLRDTYVRSRTCRGRRQCVCVRRLEDTIATSIATPVAATLSGRETAPRDDSQVTWIVTPTGEKTPSYSSLAHTDTRPE